jgi:hypothetical protein
VRAIAPDGTGTRVRVARYGQIGMAWTAVFVDAHEEPLPGGECTFVDLNRNEIDCTTALSVEQLTFEGKLRALRAAPSDALVKAIEEQRARYRPDGGKLGRIIAVRAASTRLEITAAIGADDGVTSSWKAVVVRENGSPVDGGACTIVRVLKRATTCTLSLTADQLRQWRDVLFTPP